MSIWKGFNLMAVWLIKSESWGIASQNRVCLLLSLPVSRILTSLGSFRPHPLSTPHPPPPQKKNTQKTHKKEKQGNNNNKHQQLIKLYKCKISRVLWWSPVHSFPIPCPLSPYVVKACNKQIKHINQVSWSWADHTSAAPNRGLASLVGHTPVNLTDSMERMLVEINSGNGSFAALYSTIFHAPGFHQSFRHLFESRNSPTTSTPYYSPCLQERGAPEKLSLALMLHMNVLHMIEKLAYRNNRRL